MSLLEGIENSESLEALLNKLNEKDFDTQKHVIDLFFDDKIVNQIDRLNIVIEIITRLNEANEEELKNANSIICALWQKALSTDEIAVAGLIIANYKFDSNTFESIYRDTFKRFYSYVAVNKNTLIIVNLLFEEYLNKITTFESLKDVKIDFSELLFYKKTDIVLLLIENMTPDQLSEQINLLHHVIDYYKGAFYCDHHEQYLKIFKLLIEKIDTKEFSKRTTDYLKETPLERAERLHHHTRDMSAIIQPLIEKTVSALNDDHEKLAFYIEKIIHRNTPEIFKLKYAKEATSLLKEKGEGLSEAILKNSLLYNTIKHYFIETDGKIINELVSLIRQLFFKVDKKELASRKYGDNKENLFSLIVHKACQYQIAEYSQKYNALVYMFIPYMDSKDLNRPGSQGITPLIDAIENGKKSIALALIKALPPEELDKKIQYRSSSVLNADATPLHITLQKDQIDIALELIKKMTPTGVSEETMYGGEKVALHFAMDTRREALICALVDKMCEDEVGRNKLYQYLYDLLPKAKSLGSGEVLLKFTNAIKDYKSTSLEIYNRCTSSFIENALGMKDGKFLDAAFSDDIIKYFVLSKANNSINKYTEKQFKSAYQEVYEQYENEKSSKKSDKSKKSSKNKTTYDEPCVIDNMQIDELSSYVQSKKESNPLISQAFTQMKENCFTLYAEANFNEVGSSSNSKQQKPNPMPVSSQRSVRFAHDKESTPSH
ncbi:hypothetical protein L3V79_08170 [Thiotrichales bacterium 19S9-12]|nr:hypothetical protein [Thiotrichales bacterium 19S9-11]MCF6812328.1 hypothetical protein [Thiotrichales bacterium 19S9-12]